MFTSDAQSTGSVPGRQGAYQENRIHELISALGREDITDSFVELGILAVAPLVQALKHAKDGLVKYNAALALTKIGTPAMDPLLESMDYDDADVRLEATWALGEIGDERAVEPLVEALGDEDWYVRKQAATSLCNLKNPESVGLLVRALGDEDWYVRKQAARILGTLGDARAAKPLARTLRDEDPVVKQEAAAALGRIGDPGAVADAILASLKHEDPLVRDEAVAYSPGERTRGGGTSHSCADTPEGRERETGSSGCSGYCGPACGGGSLPCPDTQPQEIAHNRQTDCRLDPWNHWRREGSGASW